jgi:hypothetical protein
MEFSRQRAEFGECKCSNCSTDTSERLAHNLSKLSVHNFDDALSDQLQFEQSMNKQKRKYSQRKPKNTSAQVTEDDKILMESLKSNLIDVFKVIYEEKWGDGSRIKASDLFDMEQAGTIVENLEEIEHCDNLSKLIGVEIIPGQHQLLFNFICNFKHNSLYQDYLNRQKDRDKVEEERKKQLKRENAARYRANARARKASGAIGGILPNPDQSSVVCGSGGQSPRSEG